MLANQQQLLLQKGMKNVIFAKDVVGGAWAAPRRSEIGSLLRQARRVWKKTSYAAASGYAADASSVIFKLDRPSHMLLKSAWWF